MTCRFLATGELDRAQKVANQAQGELAAAHASLADSSTAAGRHERKVALLTRECDGLKRILAAYKTEEAAPPGVTAQRTLQPRVALLPPPHSLRDPDALTSYPRTAARPRS